MKSKKMQLGVRVSRELYEKVRAMTEGENPAFESISDYLTFVITADLARRESGLNVTAQEMIALLDDPAVSSRLKELLK
ncbi:MAG: hypothetical protein J6J70_04485 [Methanocorpusculaceae archaeon]|nr:hypothetical protein [Methanocorpusculaceae archaeon]